MICIADRQLKEVNRHPWACAGGKGEMELEAPMMDVVQTHIIPARDAIDDDVLRGITSIGCFKVGILKCTKTKFIHLKL